MDIQVSAVLAAAAQSLLFGGVAYFGYRVYRNAREGEVLRGIGLITMVVSLLLLAGTLFFLIFAGGIGYVEMEHMAIPSSPVSR
ncbi:MAG: hypothetical protein F4X72_01750 [Dehalococcoidia bacterium]|nr:hypothetical protein [Dehalococcoidia bacterium]